MSERNGRGTFSLDQARQLTPPVNPLEAMRKQLALAAFDAVKEQDVIDVINKLKEKALAGDKQAISMFLKLVLPKDQPAAAPPPADAGESVGLKMMAQAIENLVDEIRVGKAMSQRKNAVPVIAGSREDDE